MFLIRAVINSQSHFQSLDSHLMGMFYRTIRMMDNGIKPVYVFDGKPPEMKSGEVSFLGFFFMIVD